MDVINRLRPVITELERIEDNVLIITHRVVARALLGYFMNLSMDIIANLDVPLHCVYCLEPKPYGITWSLWEYDEASDSFSKVPQTDLNTTRVKEVGLVYNERRYSVIPTAPPSARSSFASDFLSRKDLILLLHLHPRVNYQNNPRIALVLKLVAIIPLSLGATLTSRMKMVIREYHYLHHLWPLILLITS